MNAATVFLCVSVRASVFGPCPFEKVSKRCDVTFHENHAIEESPFSSHVKKLYEKANKQFHVHTLLQFFSRFLLK